MTKRMELDESTIRALRQAEEQRTEATDRYSKMIERAAEVYGISAVARALGVTRQAIQARLTARKVPAEPNGESATR
jgi:hypothetical protein